MTLGAFDIAVAAAAFTALALSALALWLSYRRAAAAERRARVAAEDAERSATAAGTSAEAASRSAEEARRGNELVSQHLEQAAVEDAERREASKVIWWVDHRRGDGYDLCNIGTGAARDVSVSVPGHPPALLRDLPQGVTIEPGASHEFVVRPAWPVPRPRHIQVAWKGHDEPLAVPLPLQQ
jgi:hypothetical protein